MNELDIDTIREGLRNPDEEIRREGVLSLSSHPLEEIKELLIQALGDRSWRVRKTTLEVIGKISKPQRLIPHLIDALRAEENVGLRNSAMEALIKMGGVALPSLRRFLNDPDKDLRKFIVDCISGIGKEEVIDDLIEAVNDPDENVKIAAVEALGKIGSPKALNPLLKVLRGGDLAIKFSALEALSHIGQPIPLQEVYNLMNSRILKKAAFDFLKYNGDLTSIPYLLEGIKDSSKVIAEAALIAFNSITANMPDKEGWIRGHIKETADKKTIERALKTLESEDIAAKRGAVSFLKLLGEPSFLPELINTLADERIAEDVEDAILSMGRRAVPTLLDVYPDKDTNVRILICSLLGRLGDVKGVELLSSALRDENGHIRASAAIALGIIGCKEAIDPLIHLLEDRYGDVRSAVRRSLALLGEKWRKLILERLTPLASSPSASLRMNAIALLGEIGGEESLDYLLFAIKDEDQMVRKAAIDIIGELGIKGAAEDIIAALADESPEVRRAAARALGNLRYKEAVDPLLLCLKDGDQWVRCEVIQGLGNIGGERAVQVLKEFVLDESGIIAIKAIEALKKIAPESSRGLFLNALRHKDKEVKKAALEALKETKTSHGLKEDILSLLEDEDWDVRNEAAKTIRSLGTTLLLPKLKEYLKNEADPIVKSALEGAITHISKRRQGYDAS